MTQAIAGWQEGQQVHRPFAFLLGEKLDGRLQSIDSSASTPTGQVAWTDGEVTDELLEDLAHGSRPTSRKRWWQRLLSA